MTVESINLGARQHPSTDEPNYWVSAGKSMAGDIVTLNFGRVERTIPLRWARVTATNKNSIEAALAAKIWQAVTVVTDAGDDLGYGASGTVTDLIYIANSFRARHSHGIYWEVTFSLLKIT